MALPLLLSAVSLIPHAGSPLPTTGVVVRRPLLLAASQAGRPVAPEDSLLAARPPPSAPQLPAMRPNVLLAVLLALYVSNQWARSLPSYLVSFDPVSMQAAGAGHRLLNVGLGFNQAQYGLLVSYGFALLYTAFSFPAGYACDRFSRTRLLLGAALAWAAATMAQGMASCFAHVLIARVLLGIAQSFSGPAAHTLISDTFPASRRATANSIYSSGIYLGAALASLSAVLGQSVGWRATSFTVAAASAVPALCLALLIKEPPRPEAAAAAAAAAGSGGGGGGATRGSRPAQVLRVASVRLVLAAAAARLFSGFAIGAWCAPFYRTYFPTRTREFAVLNALIVAGGGTLATVMGGVLSDRLTSGGKGHLAAYVPALGSLVAIPCWVAAMQARAFLPSMGWLLVAYLLAETWFGATISFLQGGLPPSVWGTAQGLLNVVQVAGNASPLLIGAALQRGASLRTMLTLCVPAGYLVCAALFFLAARARHAELAAGKAA